MKTGFFALLAVVICVAVVIGIWNIAYDWKSRLPGHLEAETLQSPAEIRWGKFRTAEIHASSLSDALLGLGYVQGQLNGWTVALWRQAALGRLSDWYGNETAEADRLTRQLGLSEIAQASYSGLNPEESDLIEAFGAGIQLAWDEADHMHEFFLQDVIPEPWEPWHALAIERLMAWVSTSPDAACNLGVQICSGTQSLRAALLMHDFKASSAWVVSAPQGDLLYQRHVLGSSISPAFQEVILKISSGPEVHGASLLGTPFFPAGKTMDNAWALLLHSPKTSRPVPDSSQYAAVRLNFPDREEIVHYQRSDSTFRVPESQKELLWRGFGAKTDASSWFALLRNRPARFHLWRGDGILLSSDTSWSVLGEPEFVFSANDSGIVISNDSLAVHSADYLNSIDLDSGSPVDWITDTYSRQAADILPRRLDSLRIPENAPAPVLSALTYLRNWDYRFESQSIGATIYNQWISYGEAAPEIALYEAVDYLTKQYGADESLWLWERVHTDTSRFTFRGPTDSKIYAPIVSPVFGHESTMIWGGARAVAAPSTWEMWTWMESDSSPFIRRRDVDLRQPLGRYISGKRGSIVFSLPTSYLKTTLLVPK